MGTITTHVCDGCEYESKDYKEFSAFIIRGSHTSNLGAYDEWLFCKKCTQKIMELSEEGLDEISL